MKLFRRILRNGRFLLDQVMDHPRREHDAEDHRTFAEGWCVEKIVMFFVIGSIIGTYYEQLLYFCQTLVWESRRGLIYGPFSPVYGIGFAVFVLALGKGNETRPWYKTYLYSTLLGGVAEYVMSWFQEVFLHTKSWDYTGYFLSIDGRTTIPFMMFWGLGGLVFMKFLYPVLSNLIEQIPYYIAKFAYPVLVVFLCLDVMVSGVAVIRQGRRLEGQPPLTVVGVWCDRVYTDEYLKEVFPNMVFGSVEGGRNIFSPGT